MEHYKSWASVPQYLKTKSGLNKAGLKRRPRQKIVATVAAKMSRNSNSYALYDTRECLPKPERTEDQKKAFLTLLVQTHCQRCHTRIKKEMDGYCRKCKIMVDRENEDRQEAIHSAKSLFLTDFVILDTETTGLSADSRIVEISIIDGMGNVLLNTLVNPEMEIPKEASAIHGITDEMVKDQPVFDQIKAQVLDLIGDKMVVIFNADYDRGILQTAGVDLTNTYCAMKLAARFIANYSEKYNNWRYYSLSDTLYWLEVDPMGKIFHRALDDCKATLTIIKAIATKN